MRCPEASGIEFDWFARDLAGRVALFCSGGSGQVPPILVGFVAEIEALQRDIGVGYESLEAERAASAGFYVYDVDIHGGPFRRIAKPRAPKRLEDLPEAHRELVARVVVDGSFAALRRIPCDRIRYGRADSAPPAPPVEP